MQTPNSELVQVNYNRVVPETVEGSLDEPQIRELLMLGMKPAAANGVRADSVALLAGECKAGHECSGQPDGKGIRGQLLVALRYDKDPGVRMKALEGLAALRRPGPQSARRGAGGADARRRCAGADGSDRPAGAGAVGFERAAGAADGVDAG